MHNTGTIFSGHKITCDHLMSAFRALYPREQLLVSDTYQFFSFDRLPYYAEGDLFIEVSI